MSARPTKRERRRLSRQYGYGHRPVNHWGDGDLPAPYAEGDLLYLPERYDHRAMRSMGEPGFYVVACAFSVDEGDAWYFRVARDPQEGSSDRLHVAYVARSSWETDVDRMAPFELVDSADPEGLALRERMLDAGWSYSEVEPHP